MKSFIQLLFLFILISNSILSQWKNISGNLPQTQCVSWSIAAVDREVAYLSAQDMYKTIDGGNNWTKLDYAFDPSVQLSAPDKDNVWGATTSGEIIYSSDGGNTWLVQFDDSTKTLFMNYIKMFDTKNGIAMGDSPMKDKPALFLKTTNGGIDWIKTNSDSTMLNVYSGDTWRRIDFLDISTGYFEPTISGSSKRKIYKTSSSGKEWLPTNFTTSINILKFYNEDIGLTYSYTGNIERTKDGGKTSQLIKTSMEGWGNDIEFLPENPSLIWMTDYKNLFFSEDTGTTWTKIILKQSGDLKGRDLQIVDKNCGWLLCDDYQVFKNDNANQKLTVENSLSKSIMNDYELSQNYPNPFNPTTTISYTIPARSRVELKVFDILGKEVATLVNEEKQVGKYEVEFRAASLSSGIYMYRINAGEFTSSKKLILVK